LLGKNPGVLRDNAEFLIKGFNKLSLPLSSCCGLDADAALTIAVIGGSNMERVSLLTFPQFVNTILFNKRTNLVHSPHGRHGRPTCADRGLGWDPSVFGYLDPTSTIEALVGSDPKASRHDPSHISAILPGQCNVHFNGQQMTMNKAESLLTSLKTWSLIS